MAESPVRQAPIRFAGRSFMALVLAPDDPFEAWLAGLDGLAARSPGFFHGRPVILDVTALRPDGTLLDGVIDQLRARDVRIVGLEGAESRWLRPDHPPALRGGRAVAEADDPRVPAVPEPKARSLVVDGPVRSGQSVIHLDGDVTVVGAVASGAEVIAGGSVHVYGALRGRAIAGSAGDPGSRIHCSRLEAELLSIDGYYKTADDIPPDLFGRAATVRLFDDVMRITGQEG